MCTNVYVRNECVRIETKTERVSPSESASQQVVTGLSLALAFSLASTMNSGPGAKDY